MIRRCSFVLLVTILMVLATAVPPLQAWNFQGKSLLGALELVARKGRLNLATSIPDGPLPAFICPAAASPREALAGLAKAAGLAVLDRFDTVLVMTREEFRQRQSPVTRLLHAAERPVEAVLEEISPNFPPPGVHVLLVPQSNTVILTGFPDDLNSAATRFSTAATRPASLIRQTLFSGADLPEGATSLTVLGIEGCPVTWTAGSGSAARTVILKPPHLPGHTPGGVAHLPGSASETPRKVESLPPTLILSVPGGNTAPSPSEPRRSAAQTGSAGDKWLDYVRVDKPVTKVLQELLPGGDESGLACLPACTGSVSVFFFGPDENFTESLFRCVAEARGMGIRKIGNSWQVGLPRDVFASGFDFSLYVTRRFQYLDAPGVAWLVASYPLSLEQRERVRQTSDADSNALVFTGPGAFLNEGMRFLECLDVAPARLDLTISRVGSCADGEETLQVQTGKLFSRMVGDGVATLSLELLPVLLERSGGRVACRFTCAQTRAGATWRISGWTFLPAEKGHPLIEIAGPRPFQIAISGSVQPLPARPGFDSSCDKSPDPSGTPDGSADGSPLDNAFDSSF